jgi:hypothetical protein
MTETAERAHVVLADVATYGKDGTYTSADRRVLRLKPAVAPQRDAQPAWLSLRELGRRLAGKLSRDVKLDIDGPEAIMEEIASLAPAYAEARYDRLRTGKTRALPAEAPSRAALQRISVDGPPAEGLLTLVTGRSLTSLEAPPSLAGSRQAAPGGVGRDQPGRCAASTSARGEVVLVNGSASWPSPPPSPTPAARRRLCPLLQRRRRHRPLPPNDGRPLLPQVRVAVRQPA